MKPLVVVAIVLIAFAVLGGGGALSSLGQGHGAFESSDANKEKAKAWIQKLPGAFSAGGIGSGFVHTTCDLDAFQGRCGICVEHSRWLPGQARLVVTAGPVSFGSSAEQRAAAFEKLGDECRAVWSEDELADSPNCEEDPCTDVKTGDDAKILVQSPGGVVLLTCKNSVAPRTCSVQLELE